MIRFSCLVLLATLAVGCATSFDPVPIDYQLLDHPEESRFELVYHNHEDYSVCIEPEAWPDSEGRIAGSPQILVLVIGNRGFPVTAEPGFWGHCDPMEPCLIHVAPGEVLSVSIPYSSFTIPKELQGLPKELDWVIVGHRCPRNGRKWTDELGTPTALFVWVEVARSTSVGQHVRLKIDVVNHLTTQFGVDDIDVSPTYLDGFDILGIYPEPSEPVDPGGGTTTFTFNHTIEPGASWNVDIFLKATKPGAFAGDVDIWSGDDYISTRAQTLVRQ